MKKILAVFLMVAGTLILTGSVLAQEKEAKTEKAEKKDKPKEVTVVGEVIDSECYMKMGDMALSEDHKNCAEACAKGGVPLALLEDKTKNVYFTANEGMSMKGTNEKLMPYIGEKVSIKGKLFERGGAKLLVISSVEKTE